MHPQHEAADRGPVAVLVVTWNSAAVLPGFLAALPQGMAGLDWRLVVADNDSSDDSVAVVRELAPEATVVETGRNGGYAFGVNAALRAAAAWEGGFRAALVCNPDIRMGEGCAATLVDALGTPCPTEHASGSPCRCCGRRTCRSSTRCAASHGWAGRSAKRSWAIAGRAGSPPSANSSPIPPPTRDGPARTGRPGR